ncbi:BtpA/SgcQ family protein [Vampirovibrio sp.]|uniref:BtpA/SgcQ family protein n=1 Tax=Vampirovibrio sp. TaxID=2717857 RepID=UPI0035932D8F
MLSEIFQKPKPIIGSVQLLALPGSPDWDGHWDSLTARAEQEATALATGGVDGLILENRHDTPFSRGRMDVAGAIAMALLTRRLKQFTNLPIGISVLQNDPETALAIAMNTGADFLRLSVLSGALMTESGVINSRLNELLHYKNRLKVALPPILVDLSHQHLSTGGPSVANPEEQRLAHLLRVAETLPQSIQRLSLVISDQALSPELLPIFMAQVAFPVLVVHQNPLQAPDALFEQAHGLILETSIRKASALQAHVPPTIDMPKVEEVVNRLRGIKSVAEMDPDLFLKR